jgi:hypothetical protein
MVPVVGPVAVRATVTVVGALVVREAEVAQKVGPVTAIGGQVPGAALVEGETTIGGGAVTVGSGRVSGRIAGVGVPMRPVRPAGGEWHDVVPAVSSARNTRTAPSAGNGPPSGRLDPVVPSPSDLTA